jgi:hypothetical protein
MQRMKFVVPVALGALLVACGGGGGGDGGTAAPAALTLSASAAKVRVGESVTLTWNASNVTSCQGADAWSGSQAASGSTAITPTAGGKFTYTLNCTGASGTVSQSVQVTVPMPVLATSYENRMAAGNQSAGKGLPYRPPGYLTSATAYGDFFQDGSYAMVSHTLEYDPANVSTANAFGHVAFFAKDAAGKWVDRTSELLADTQACLHPRKASIADFNGDGQPHVFFACHGFDSSPFPGEQPHVLLSQPSGKYKNVTLPQACFCHSASAADLNGDGKPDVVVTDTSVALKPYVLINDGNGETFTQDFGRMPASLNGGGMVYSLELIDTGSGKPDLFFGVGTPPGSDPANPSPVGAVPNGILKNDGDGRFLTTAIQGLPNPPGSTGITYGLALDFMVVNGYVYYPQINNAWDASNPFYANTIVHKARLSDLSVTTLYEHFGAYNNGITWFPWLALGTDGKMNVECDQYVYDPATLPGSSCGVSFPL